MPVIDSKKVEKGDRIRLVEMPNDPDPIPPGTEGVVGSITEFNFNGSRPEVQLIVKWDNGRSLSCICPPDVVEVLGKDTGKLNTD